MSDFDCRNELVLRERRGELSPAERVALDAHLTQCSSCRLGRLLGSDFEAEATLEPDDGVRIAALSATAERWAAGRPGSVRPLPLRRRRARIALLAVAAALAAVGASAARGTLSEIFGDEKPAAAPQKPATPAPLALAEKAHAASASNAPKTETAATEIDPTEPKSASPRAPVETAASLFAEASGARRAGDSERAIALYRRLENEFPKSPEAGLSGLPLGGLLLDRGEARRALAQFDRHLKGGQASRLLPEALYGRGRSLAALGNRSEERRTWKMLLEQFPESPYAGHARRRLSELGPG